MNADRFLNYFEVQLIYELLWQQQPIVWLKWWSSLGNHVTALHFYIHICNNVNLVVPSADVTARTCWQVLLSAKSHRESGVQSHQNVTPGVVLHGVTSTCRVFGHILLLQGVSQRTKLHRSFDLMEHYSHQQEMRFGSGNLAGVESTRLTLWHKTNYKEKGRKMFVAVRLPIQSIRLSWTMQWKNAVEQD